MLLTLLNFLIMFYFMERFLACGRKGILLYLFINQVVVLILETTGEYVSIQQLFREMFYLNS